jgi:serine/threonine protein phosphatase PrpC
MIVDVNARSDLGCGPANNEDLILIGPDTVRNRAASASFALDDDRGRLLLALADGMGGAAGGEQASEIALHRVRELMAELPDDLTAEELELAMTTWARETHEALGRASQADPALAGMGTTVVALLLYCGSGYRFHAGDSRLYRCRGGALTRMTSDHSLREQSHDANAPANILVNSLGGGAASRLEFHALEDGLERHDRFLLSSDGLHDAVSETAILAALSADRETAVGTLVQLARGAGSPDNISVLIADLARTGADT